MLKFFKIILASLFQDLKPANLLIANDGKLKIADFGLARIYTEEEPTRLYSHQVATRWYRAPELLYGAKNYTNAVDLWAVGCIMGEMYTRKPLFQVIYCALKYVTSMNFQYYPQWNCYISKNIHLNNDFIFLDIKAKISCHVDPSTRAKQ